jgi:hypothetical protein
VNNKRLLQEVLESICRLTLGSGCLLWIEMNSI